MCYSQLLSFPRLHSLLSLCTWDMEGNQPPSVFPSSAVPLVTSRGTVLSVEQMQASSSFHSFIFIYTSFNFTFSVAAKVYKRSNQHKMAHSDWYHSFFFITYVFQSLYILHSGLCSSSPAVCSGARTDKQTECCRLGSSSLHGPYSRPKPKNKGKKSKVGFV